MKRYILLMVVLLSSKVQADSLMLTCDFRYSSLKGITMEVPANCTKAAIKALGNKRPLELSREIFMSALPKSCPNGYRKHDKYQGGVTATNSLYLGYNRPSNLNVEHIYYYQTRKICISGNKKIEAI